MTNGYHIPSPQASICSNILILALRSITRYPVAVVAKIVTQLQNHQMRSLKCARGFFVLYLLTIIVHIDLHRLKASAIIWERGITYSQHRSVWGDIKAQMEGNCIYMSRILDNRSRGCRMTLFLEITKIVHCKLELVKQRGRGLQSSADHRP